MEWYHYAMAGAAGAALAFSYKRPRAMLWIGLLAASYLVSVGYLVGYEAIEAANQFSFFTAGATNYVALSRDWLPPAVVAAMCDIAAATVVKFAGRERWETTWLAGAIFAMAAFNLVFASGVIFGFPPVPEKWVLGSILEAINVLALVLVVFGGTGIVDWINERTGVRGGIGRLLARSLSYLRTQEKRSLWKAD